MIKVIETHVMITDDNKIKRMKYDNEYNPNIFQSRVIEVESWDKVIEIFTSERYDECEQFTDIFGRYEGSLRQRESKIENLNYDNGRLTCIVNTHKCRVQKLIERIHE